MPSPISYRNWINSPAQISAAEGDAWTNVGNAATRQLAAQAVSNISPEEDEEEGDGNINIDVDLGAVREVGCIAILGHGFIAQPSECNVMVFGSAGTPGGADAVNISQSLSVAFLQRVATPHLVWWISRNELRYLRFRFQGYPHLIRIGRLWAGPVWGQSTAYPHIADVPTCENPWALTAEPAAVSAYSKGQQGFSGTSSRARGCRMQFTGLSHRHAIGDQANSVGWQEIIESADADLPMLVSPRVQHPVVDDAFLRLRHTVYGVQTNPSSINHSANGGDLYDIDLAFRGEK